MDADAQKRAYKIMKLFMSIENPDERLIGSFHEWLLNGHNQEEKDAALRMVFDEIIGGSDPGEVAAAEIEIFQTINA